MTPADLSRTVLHTVRRAVEDDELRAPVPERVSVRVPPRPGCGDYATNVALQLAKGGDRPALEIAEVLRRRLVARPGIARVDIAGPGFLNITLDAASGEEIVREVLETEFSGEALALRPLGAEEVARLGSDAARWSLLSPPGLDRSLLLVQKDSNPLFRVRYAHSRSRALQRNAHDLGFGPSVGPLDRTADTLLGALADHARITAARAPERLARHLERTADAFLRWQAGCSVLPRSDEKPLAVHRARLALAEATGKVLANGLTQLGITAPAHL
ncbi:ArgS-related anticodon-binding protein NrtL [Streptomyces sp. NPDC001678]|uniref:ArgS-related anticodon-binding protein NrtL n=1 Tax=Streptomyces sp. NPDC001678 TaxID=3364599 RepID=UPI00369224CC